VKACSLLLGQPSQALAYARRFSHTDLMLAVPVAVLLPGDAAAIALPASPRIARAASASRPSAASSLRVAAVAFSFTLPAAPRFS